MCGLAELHRLGSLCVSPCSGAQPTGAGERAWRLQHNRAHASLAARLQPRKIIDNTTGLIIVRAWARLSQHDGAKRPGLNGLAAAQAAQQQGQTRISVRFKCLIHSFSCLSSFIIRREQLADERFKGGGVAYQAGYTIGRHGVQHTT